MVGKMKLSKISRYVTTRNIKDEVLRQLLGEWATDDTMDAVIRAAYGYRVDRDDRGNELRDTAGFEQVVTDEELMIIVEGLLNAASDGGSVDITGLSRVARDAGLTMIMNAAGDRVGVSHGGTEIGVIIPATRDGAPVVVVDCRRVATTVTGSLDDAVRLLNDGFGDATL